MRGRALAAVVAADERRIGPRASGAFFVAPPSLRCAGGARGARTVMGADASG